MVWKAKVLSYSQSFFSLSYGFVSNKKIKITLSFHLLISEVCANTFVLMVQCLPRAGVDMELVGTEMLAISVYSIGAACRFRRTGSSC